MSQSSDQPFRSIEGQSALVTGGAGFIGSHLVAALLQAGVRVRIIDDLSSGHAANVPDDARLIRSSILDHDALAEACEGCSLVFHHAAMVSVPQSVAEPDRCLATNVVGTQRVLEAARRAGVRRVVFAASSAAYGAVPRMPSAETDPAEPVSPYAMSKVAGELLMRTWSAAYGLSTVSLRYFNIYGPRQDPASPYAAVISAFAERLTARTPPTIYGDGRQTRDFTFVRDVVRANLLAATTDRPLAGEVINVGTGTRTSLLDLLTTMALVVGAEARPSFAPARPGDVRDSCADASLARTLLGFGPTVGIEAGLRETLDWFTGSTAQRRGCA